MSSTTVAAGDDPRDASAEAPLTFPDSWQVESPVRSTFTILPLALTNTRALADAFSSSVMFASGLIMVTRNRYLSWPSLLLSINSVINQHPLRAKEGGQSPASTIVLAVAAVVASYLPLVLLGPDRTLAASAA
ncbi:hypothetical protein A0H81_03234 [Grifola frondosa]|uniref:Uncharacterized protein n=1 Tax=Grifola frondosa TaxID=5627 RepID=A0A1C7MGT8_GRIFR|nr:hypothetical protein A0H81_03234 [Grifola frondosa]